MHHAEREKERKRRERSKGGRSQAPDALEVAGATASARATAHYLRTALVSHM